MNWMGNVYLYYQHGQHFISNFQNSFQAPTFVESNLFMESMNHFGSFINF